MLGAGSLKESITFKAPQRVSNGSGGFTTTFVPYLTTYADVKQKSLSNDLIAQQPELIGTFEAKIRYRQDHIIKVGHRVGWRGRECEIIGLPAGFINREFIKILIKTTNESTDASV